MASAGSDKKAGQIELQIVGPSGVGKREGGSAGGGFGEWAGKMWSMGCIGVMALMMVGAGLGVAAGALWYSYGMNPDTTCLGTVAGISFSYVSWMRWMGWTYVAGTALELILLFAHGCSGTILSSKLATVWGVIFFLFETAWYAVGAVLYWRTVPDHCESGSALQTLALAIFIIQSATVCSLVCFRKAAEHIV